MRIALFPGSFDPITLGHLDIVTRGAGLFDEVVVALGVNSAKQGFFSVEDRIAMLQATFAHLDNVRVAQYSTLTVEFAREQGAQVLLRGLRDGKDLEYERPIALINQHMDKELETVFLVAMPQYSHISSTLVREVIRYGHDVEGLVPDAILPFVDAKRQGN